MSAVRQSITGLIFSLNSSSSTNSKEPPAGQQHPWQASSKSAWTGKQHNQLSKSNNMLTWCSSFSSKTAWKREKTIHNLKPTHHRRPSHSLTLWNFNKQNCCQRYPSRFYSWLCCCKPPHTHTTTHDQPMPLHPSPSKCPLQIRHKMDSLWCT